MCQFALCKSTYVYISDVWPSIRPRDIRGSEGGIDGRKQSSRQHPAGPQIRPGTGLVGLLIRIAVGNLKSEQAPLWLAIVIVFTL